MQAQEKEVTAEHVVILGGGFGGWYAARGLAYRLARHHRITLIDRFDHMLYTPMLTEVAGGTMKAADIAVPVTKLPSRVRFIQGEITAVDAAMKVVTLRGGITIQATQLVFALGSVTSYHQIPGARESSLSLKTLADAEAVVKAVDEMVRCAARCTEVEERRKLLTVAVAGGGYTGVESMAAISEHLYRRVKAVGIDEKEVKLVLIEPSERIMHETDASLAAYSQKELESIGVRIMLNTGVREVEDKTVKLTDGSSHDTGLLVWDTGIEPNPMLEAVDLPKGSHHGLVTDGCFRVQIVEGVWAIGDCAEIPKPDGKGTFAPTAQNATREGSHLAQNINAVLRGRAPSPFRYKMIGQLALLSRRRAVAEVYGLKFKGLFAWAMWWGVYTLKLPYMVGRFGVVRRLTSRPS